MSFEVSLKRSAEQPSIAILTVDNPPVNANSIGVPGAVIARLREAEAAGDLAGIVLAAGGRGGFAGADIRAQGKPWPKDEPRTSDMIAALDASPLPVAVLLRGHALGGGLEIAMACRYRVATPATQLGQPEVKLGIPPGAGGTIRLPRLVGVETALDMVLHGKPIDARKALTIGLIDLLAESADPLAEAVAFLAERLAEGPRPPTQERPIPAFKPEIFDEARKTAARRYRGQTAPLVCIDCVETAARLPFAQALAFERARFDDCVASEEAAALRHVFFAERQKDKLPGIDRTTPRRDLVSAAVVGAGTMGAGIAMCFANAGLPVRLIERDEAALQRGLDRIAETYAGLVKRGRLAEAEAGARRDRIAGALTLDAVAEADIVIEAVFEDLVVKRQVFQVLADAAKPGAILASNTSYLDVDRIAAAAGARAEDVLGLHFFSPANIMPLLEIVRGQKTSPEVLATALDLGKHLGKVGIVAGVCHGFIANRMFATYLREAEFLLGEGATPGQVDEALVDFGFPMGPFAVRDLAGLDIGWANRQATAHLRKPGERYSRIGDIICEEGWFGQKTGKGFYLYEAGSRAPLPNPAVEKIIARTAAEDGIARREIGEEEIIERCLYACVNEGAKILEEGIALRASDIDLVWINGYGFPRWRGGPMFWAGGRGLAGVLETLRGFDAVHDFWSPAPLLTRLAEAGKSFVDFDREGTP